MNLLAIDTTHRTGGVVLTQEKSVLEAVAIEAPNGFGAVIYSEIEALLERTGLTLQDIDCYAAAAGPGSFTGIRVGLSVVKALAEVHNKTVAPVSSLQALAHAGVGKYRAAVMDARRQEVYAAVYDDHLKLVVDEVVTEWEEFRASLYNRSVTFVSLNSSLFDNDEVSTSRQGVTGDENQVVITERPLTMGVAHIAQTLFEQGKTVAPEMVDANYIRRPEAELKWKDPD
jgi:tRNA threonylcarbamoyladenosine biosynthesis protein TsaB